MWVAENFLSWWDGHSLHCFWIFTVLRDAICRVRLRDIEKHSQIERDISNQPKIAGLMQKYFSSKEHSRTIED